MSRQSRRKYSTNKPSGRPAGEVRIIAGEWRGRRLPVASAEGLRPTADRVRETLFNWLQFELAGRNCLDAFAGTGVLGLEALSRGAASAWFIEHNSTVAAGLAASLQKLQASNARVQQGDALLLTQQPADKAYDLVFIDPPWQLQCQQQLVEQLINNRWLAADALIYIENNASTAAVSHSQLLEIKSKTIGEVMLMLYRYKEMQK